MTTFDDFKEKIHSHAKDLGCKVNDKLFPKLDKMMSKHGVYYCPCREIENLTLEERDKVICPCLSHQDDLKNKKRCHCGLFYR